MKTLALELSPSSCNKALKELEKYKREIEPKLDEVCKRLAEIGAQEVTQIVSQVRFQDDNFVDYVGVEPIDNGYKIVMRGEDVYFIEFGTGSYVEPHYQTSVPVFAGSWSMEHAQKYAKQGWWWYGGEPLVGTEAYMPMYYAGKKMREEMPRIVKEVFGK